MLHGRGADFLLTDKKGFCVITLMLRHEVYHDLLMEEKYQPTLCAYALDAACRAATPPELFELLKIFLKYRPEQKHAYNADSHLLKFHIPRWSRALKHYNLFKDSERLFTPDPHFLAFLVRRVKRCYFPPGKHD